MLQGTESPGGCCAATPTKKNEVFDLQVKKKKRSENSKHPEERRDFTIQRECVC